MVACRLAQQANIAITMINGKLLLALIDVVFIANFLVSTVRDCQMLTLIYPRLAEPAINKGWSVAESNKALFQAAFTMAFDFRRLEHITGRIRGEKAIESYADRMNRLSIFDRTAVVACYNKGVRIWRAIPWLRTGDTRQILKYWIS